MAFLYAAIAVFAGCTLAPVVAGAMGAVYEKLGGGR